MDELQSGKISRREFLILAGISAVAGVQAASNLPGTSSQTPTVPPPAQPLPTANVESPTGTVEEQQLATETVQPPISTTEASQLETETTQPTPNTPEAQQLQTKYNLTTGNAQIFWVFIANRNAPLGRKKIASDLQISHNTLKDHITRILRHVRSQGNPGVKTLNQAVNIAVNVLALEEDGKQVI